MHFALKASSDDAEAQRASQAGGSTPANTGTPGKRTRSEVARLASLARWGKYKAKGKQPGKGRKKAAAKPTAEEKEAAKRQEAQANRAKLLGDNAQAMDALAMGQAPDPAQADALVASGLADKLKDGTVVLNTSGRQAYNAASSGDAGRVAELTARAKDKATPAPEAEAPKGGGGGGGGAVKPTPEEKAQAKLEARAKTASDTASRVGLAADDLAALTQSRDAGGADNQRMRDVGLLDANGDTTDQGRRALVALERGDVGSFRAAMQDAASRLEREAQTRQRAIEKLIKDAEKDKPEKPKTTRRSTRDVNGITITTRETKMDETKQSASDRAMFANMGGGRGGSGGGGGAGAKPTGGVGGLWKVDPATGERSPDQGLAKGAPARVSGKPAAAPAVGRGDNSPGNPAAGSRRAADIARVRGEQQAAHDAGREQRRAAIREQIQKDQAGRDAKPDASPSQRTSEQRAAELGRMPQTVNAARQREIFGGPVAGRGQVSYNPDRNTYRVRFSTDFGRDYVDRNFTPVEMEKLAGAGIRLTKETIHSGAVARALAGEAKPPTAKKDTDMDALKYSRRHSATDEAHLARAVSHVKGAMGALIDAGAADDDPPEAEVKALDLMTQCELVCDAVLEAIGKDDELMHGDDCDITVYADFAVLDTEGECYRIDYTIENGDVSLADASEWVRVEWDVSEIDGAEPGYEADEDDAPRAVMAPGEMKMLDDDTGYAMMVRFGTADEPDASQMRDFFTKSTDYWLDKWQTRPMLYDHAQTDYQILAVMKDKGASAADIAEMKSTLDYLHENPVVGTWTKAWTDTIAVWMSYEIDKAHKYRAAVKEMIRQGVLKVSTDSAPHLVQRVPQSNGTNWVKRWPIFAGSVTVHAAEPRLQDVGHYKGIDGLPPAYIDDPQTPALEVADATKSAERERLLALELELIEIEEMELV